MHASGRAPGHSRRWLKIALTGALLVSQVALADPASARDPWKGGTPHEGYDDQAGPHEAMTYDATQSFYDFMVAVFKDVDTYWKNQYAAWGESDVPYINAHFHAGLSETPCGYSGDPAQYTGVMHAFYCEVTDSNHPYPTIWMSIPWMDREIYRYFGNYDKAVAILIAHEFAHHVQWSFGVSTEADGGPFSSMEYELQADCLAGTWARSAFNQGYITADDGPKIAEAFGRLGDRHGRSHGTQYDRFEWFRHGFNSSDPSGCDPSAYE